MEGLWFFGCIIGVMAFYRLIVYPKKIELQNSINKKKELENELLFKDRLIKNVNDDLKNDLDLKGNKKGRAWFASMYAEVQSLLDNHRAEYLRWKKHPSYKGADIVKEVKKDKRELNKKLKVLEYELKTYEQYFPIIEDFKDYILEDDSFLIQDDGSVGQDKDFDPAQKFLKPEEFKKLPTNKKNQLALDRYLNKTHSKLEIGRFYERYIGHLYEKDGWIVKFFGIIEGFDDLGRDLICKKGNEIHIV